MALRLCVTSLIVMEHIALFVSFAPEATAGIIQTNQTYYYVGEVITLHCYADTNFVDLRFSYAADIEVPTKYVTVINDTYARMDRPAMAEDYANTIYICWSDFDEAYDVDTQTIYTEYPPQSVSNITIFFSNKKEVVIKWELGIQYKNWNYVYISVDWSSDQSNATLWKACTSLTRTSCTFNVKTETSLTLRVNVTNVRRRDTVTQVFRIRDLNDYVKPGPVTLLKKHTSSSTCVSLTWRWTFNVVISKFIISYGLMNAKQEKRNITVSETYVNICDLRPFRNYSFEVRAVPESKGYASDPAFLVVSTDEDVPQSGPRVITSGYSRNLSCVVGNNEDVFIYFQPVQENDANGILTRYCVTDMSDHRNCKPNDGTFTFNITVPCKEEFKAFLQAGTRVGFSPYTTLTVPFSSREEELHEIATKMELQIRIYKQRRFIATWEPPTDQHKYSVYLYYCQKQNASKLCKGTMNYIPLKVSHKMTSLNNVDADLFGLSLVTDENVTSGIVFTNCVYNPLVPEVYDLDRPSVEKNSDFVNISWKYRLCHRDKMIFTKSYSIEACEDINCCKKYRIEGGNITNIKLSDLRPGIIYNVTVSASIATGNSNPSEIGYAIVQPKVTDELSAVKTVIGVFSSSTFLVVLIVSVLVSYYARKMYLTRKRKFETTRFPKPTKLLNVNNVKRSAETAALLNNPSIDWYTKCLNGTNSSKRELDKIERDGMGNGNSTPSQDVKKMGGVGSETLPPNYSFISPVDAKTPRYTNFGAASVFQTNTCTTDANLQPLLASNVNSVSHAWGPLCKNQSKSSQLAASIHPGDKQMVQYILMTPSDRNSEDKIDSYILADVHRVTDVICTAGSESNWEENYVLNLSPVPRSPDIGDEHYPAFLLSAEKPSEEGDDAVGHTEKYNYTVNSQPALYVNTAHCGSAHPATKHFYHTDGCFLNSAQTVHV